MKIKIMLLTVVAVITVFISGCGEPTAYGKADHSPYAVGECRQELSRGAELDHTQLADKIVVYKKKRELSMYRKGKLLYACKISLGKNGDKGNKIRAGDYRTPEGSYTIVRKKCDPRLYRSLMISYPNEADKARAKAHGAKPGGYITIHGQPKWNADGHADRYTLAHDWTEGCMAVPNKAMATLWRSVKNGVKIDIHP
jgi:murein L,D-transpeptidase YafK